VAVRGLGVPYELVLGPTVKARPLNIYDRKSGPYITYFLGTKNIIKLILNL